MAVEVTRHEVSAQGVGDRLEALYVLALKWDDVDLENSRLSVRRTVTMSEGRARLGEPKTRKSRRSIQLTGASVTALRAHLSPPGGGDREPRRPVQGREPGLWG